MGINLEPFAESEEQSKICKILTEQIDRVIEITKAKSKNRELIRDAAVSGDGAFYAWYNPDKGKTGEIELEILDN